MHKRSDTGPLLRQSAPRPSLLAIVMALTELGTGPLDAAQPAAPTLLDRYHLADAYLHDETSNLVIDADIHAAFTADGKGLLYRTGATGHRTIRYFDLTRKASRDVVGEDALASLLTRKLG